MQRFDRFFRHYYIKLKNKFFINMKQQKLFFYSLFLCMVLALTGCNLGEKGNVFTFNDLPAVVGYNAYMGGTTIGIAGGVLSAPTLDGVYDGDCIYIHQLTIDSDNQPSQEYTTVSDVTKEIVDQTSFYNFESFDPSDLGDYTLSLANVGISTDIFYRGRVFVGATCKDKDPTFRLIFDPEEDEEEANGVRNLYLQAKPSSSSEGSNARLIHAFNFEYWLLQYGQETTFSYPGNSQKFDIYGIKVNIKYLASISGDNEPIYETIKDPNSQNKPMEFLIAIIKN